MSALRALFPVWSVPILSVVGPADKPRAAQVRSAARATSLQAPGPRDEARFRERILPLLDDAYAFARFLSRDATLADDIVQDAFLKAWRSFGAYRDGSAKAWLFSIVRSSFLTLARSRGRQSEAGDEELDAAIDDAPTPEGLLLREAADAAVRAAVDALPEPFREAIVLRELQDMSYREISDITGAPMGTVMSRLARARQMLALSLAGERS
ncbi:MAG TPA: sigma-70 family RNA polymerase sigma factor [Hyphomonadaceae bacterium]|jgi:RNA polymerase sigma-70 factor (ECF subfamily)|nr:sigma-70 family RNA polymerase sigma factor [Hyphomonadaceae bacterium]